MNNKPKILQIILRIFGFGFGLINILGGVAAFGRSGEPERYWVAGMVMLLGGILFLFLSFSKLHLQKRDLVLIFVVFVMGMVIGLFNTFTVCGGECGPGTSICNWRLGYPGRWLRIGNCMAGSEGTNWRLWILNGTWSIDRSNLVADIVFWIDVGFIFSITRKFLNSRSGFIET